MFLLGTTWILFWSRPNKPENDEMTGFPGHPWIFVGLFFWNPPKDLTSYPPEAVQADEVDTP